MLPAGHSLTQDAHSCARAQGLSPAPEARPVRRHCHTGVANPEELGAPLLIPKGPIVAQQVAPGDWFAVETEGLEGPVHRHTVSMDFNSYAEVVLHETGHYVVALHHGIAVARVRAKASERGRVELVDEPSEDPQARIEIAEAGEVGAQLGGYRAKDPEGPDDTLRYKAFLELRKRGERRSNVEVYARARDQASKILRSDLDRVARVADTVAKHLNKGDVPLDQLEAAFNGQLSDGDTAGADVDPRSEFRVVVLATSVNLPSLRSHLAESPSLLARANPHGGSEVTIDFIVKAVDRDAAGEFGLAKIREATAGVASNIRLDRVTTPGAGDDVGRGADSWDSMRSQQSPE